MIMLMLLKKMKVRNRKIWTRIHTDSIQQLSICMECNNLQGRLCNDINTCVEINNHRYRYQSTYGYINIKID